MHHETPENFIISTEKLTGSRVFELAFRHVGREREKHVYIDPAFWNGLELINLRGRLIKRREDRVATRWTKRWYRMMVYATGKTGVRRSRMCRITRHYELSNERRLLPQGRL